MINEINQYLETQFDNVTYGQIQDSPNELLNINVVNTGRKPFFKEDTQLFTVSIFLRDDSFQTLQNKVGNVIDKMINTYDKIVSQCHIVDTKLLGSNDTERDTQNRYCQILTFEMLVEKIKEV